MSKKHDEIRKELDDILSKLLSNKRAMTSDRRIISANLVSQNKNWQEKQAENRFKKGNKNHVTLLKESDPKAYNDYLEQHKLRIKQAGQTESFRKHSSKNAKAQWQDPVQKEKHKQALKQGWDKPGARQRKSQSVKEVINRPGNLIKHQERARKNGLKSSRPCVSPEGIFFNKIQWAKHTGFSADLFGYRCKKMPDQYYHISQEEYILLTGHDPFN
jgi:hypothetical protein